jgi:hypothetical protein
MIITQCEVLLRQQGTMVYGGLGINSNHMQDVLGDQTTQITIAATKHDGKISMSVNSVSQTAGWAAPCHNLRACTPALQYREKVPADQNRSAKWQESMALSDSVTRHALHARELPHAAVFPLMAMGHTIPLLDLACLLRRRGLADVTVFTTPGNAAFVRGALARGGAGDVVAVELSFPGGHPSTEAVEGVASSASSFAAFVETTSQLRPAFEEALGALRPPASLLIADGFLYWAHASAVALRVPSVSFLGASAFAHVVREACMRDRPGSAPPQQGGAGVGDSAPPATYTLPEFPHIQFPLSDFAPLPSSLLEVDAKMAAAVAASHGMILNTFHDLEGRYIEHWKQHSGLNVWPVGPLCSFRQPSSAAHGAKPVWMRWLDEKAAAPGGAVLYVALGTLVSIPEAQLREVAEGLEQAGVDFLWAVRPNNVDLGNGYEERVRGRGMVVREWVDQWKILRHACVKGFLSHCGWNSVLESVTAGVPLAAWPIGFEQPMNAKFVVDDVKVGVRVHTCDGTVQGLVKKEEIARTVRELMYGEAGAVMSKNVAKIAEQALLALSDGGSSWKAVEEMIGDLCVRET